MIGRTATSLSLIFIGQPYSELRDKVSNSKFELKATTLKSKLHTSTCTLDLDTSRTILSSQYALRPCYSPTRLPIVLIHGLYGYDNIGFDSLPQLQVQYWEGVVEALRSLGATVFVAKVPSTGSVAERAFHLDAVLSKLGASAYNLVGHSMGGLDGRYLITHIKNKPYSIASLCTVATPHRGSPFMDWCRDNLRVGLGDKPPQDWFGRLMRILDTPAYAHLTTEYCETQFNPNTPDDPGVCYFSYNAYVDSMPWTNLLRFPWAVIQGVAGQNDGVVPLASGVWGRLVETVHASHFDLVARYRWFVALSKAFKLIHPHQTYDKTMPFDSSFPSKSSQPPKFDNIDFYLRMSTFLNSEGF